MSDTDQTLKRLTAERDAAVDQRMIADVSRREAAALIAIDLAIIRSHTLNELAVSPQSVAAHDCMFLLGEIERLRARVADLEAESE
jgi:NAD kinase